MSGGVQALQQQENNVGRGRMKKTNVAYMAAWYGAAVVIFVALLALFGTTKSRVFSYAASVWLFAPIIGLPYLHRKIWRKGSRTGKGLSAPDVLQIQQRDVLFRRGSGVEK